MTAYAPYPQQAPSDPTAVVGRRILAYGIDLLLGLAAALLLVVPQVQDKVQTVSALEFQCGGDFDFGDSERTPVNSDLCWEWGDEVNFVPQDDTDTISQLFYLGYFGVGLANLVVLQALTGGSIGKLLVGLRVIREDGQVAGIGRMALRWVLLIVDSFCCFLPGAVLVFSTKGHRRLGDMAASTLVVSKRQVGTPPVVPGVTAPEMWPGPQVPGWAPPPTGAGWPPPATGPDAPMPGTPTSPPGPARTDGPIWDDARNTYIQWDAPREQWVQWDETASEWRPIDR